jgi:hypothetical protein
MIYSLSSALNINIGMPASGVVRATFKGAARHSGSCCKLNECRRPQIRLEGFSFSTRIALHAAVPYKRKALSGIADLRCLALAIDSVTRIIKEASRSLRNWG